jgi:C6 transcription factor Pro1
LMGCDDRIMFLISEVACLDVQKSDGLNELMLCKYVEVLANEIRQTELESEPVQNCFSATGAIRPKQLRTNMTEVFRLATRIYLCGLVPGAAIGSPSTCTLISNFCTLMNFIPAGPDGFDRSLVWPLLIAGANSVAEGPFRSMFAERCERLGDAANFGSFGRVRELLHDIWQANDTVQQAQGELQGVHWRDVMQQKNWDYLLI